MVVAGDTCETISLRYGLTLDEFLSYNTQIQQDCSNLWLSYSVCVAPVTPMPTSTDGTCGPANSGVVCGDSGFGDCCSRQGYCRLNSICLQNYVQFCANIMQQVDSEKVKQKICKKAVLLT